ncbi:phosphatidylglycerophosphatase A family protein [Helicobacter mustelae]|uniref:Putative phosphatidylglycerophosphatase n=1 Tax=Helicobacter mustelae (strain ATCC 43772 / CCUG 25715 / CIP 103759 / LMG 18044 / NCTC 12198 / R85-136P) TaxID=679897 RepID=D3UJC8_HELM1|nr:phosphatidylglycerophosphatase A [Helicobacter mustelae]CBG40603.1 putative phosphatidylglycerophosphatase [Helicobacter mustelae 12198]SQH72100.1 phosphatidylglycerophosphatase [Helicobacter mustelae]STP13244.1 phosphatidylglycerophosphatase [Helicobacter mustelae]
MNFYRECFLTLFFSGKSPIAPGTMGSVVAMILGIPLLWYSSEMIFLLAILIGIIASKQIDIYEAQKGMHDPKEIVIDELVGMWIAMGIAGGGMGGISFMLLGFCFLFFRILDIKKPSFIGRVDREVKGGLGVVLDDALAGVFAGIITLLLLKIWGFFAPIF